MAYNLDLDVFIGPLEQMYVTSTIISGDREAILVDAQFTLSSARQLADHVKELGKTLTAVFITHPHPDHYWGLAALRREFPDTQFLAAPEVVNAIERHERAKLAQWKPVFGDDVPDEPIRPEPLGHVDVLRLENFSLEILHEGAGDSRNSTVLWIPGMSALIAGDLAYNGCHVWLAEGGAEERRAWADRLRDLAEMYPSVAVAGHKKPGTDDSGRRVILDTRDYILAFDEELQTVGSPEDLVAAMTRRFPDLALHAVLEASARAAFTAVAT